MRHGRAKAARKTLQFFARQGISPPFSVVVDGTFLVQSILHKVPLVERMEKILQHSAFSLFITRSSLEELQVLTESVPEEKRNAIQQARQWGLDECEIIEHASIPNEEITVTEELGVPGTDIVKLVQSRTYSVIVATQDETLLDVLRNTGLSPLLRLSRGVLLLENPSKAAQQRAQHYETKKYSHASVKKSEVLLAKSVREETRASQQEQEQQQPQSRVKRKAKGPNPLSCKKKKTTQESSSSTKRKRRRKKTENKKSEASAS